jgi:hypothetical protein
VKLVDLFMQGYRGPPPAGAGNDNNSGDDQQLE